MLDYNDKYLNWLSEEISRIAHNNNMERYKFHFFNEQDFIKSTQMDKDDIFVIVKKLSTEIMFNAKIQPLQITIMSEQNSLEVANFIFKEFANKNNWIVIAEYTPDGNATYIKHQYTEPIVLNNFVEYGNGYRSVLYVSASLYIMENVIDTTNIRINGETIEYIDFSLAYTLATDTQPMPNDNFVESVRQTQTIGFSLTIPSKVSNFSKECFKIIANEISGDKIFKLTIPFQGVGDVTYNTRLSGLTFATAKNNIPTIKVGLIK